MSSNSKRAEQSEQLDMRQINIACENQRKEMAADVRKHILDPIALASLLIGKKIHAGEFEPEREDFSRMLNLLVMGAHSELDIICSWGGHLGPPLSDILEGNLDRQWFSKEEMQS